MNEIDDFLSYLTADRGYSPRTVRTYREALISLHDHFTAQDAALTWQTLHADNVRRWMMACIDSGQSARTVAKQLSAVRSLYKYLLRTERVDHDPVRLVANPKVHKPLPTFLRRSEVERLFDLTFPPTYEGRRDHAILLTFYHTGIRLSELVGLNVADIDLGAGELKVTGKRNKQRIVPFGPELRACLAAYVEERQSFLGTANPERALFLSSRAVRISPAVVQRIVRDNLTLVTNQKKRSPHVLRHTFATEMLSGGANLEAIKELLGHESITTTEVYTHTTLSDLKNEYKHAHPRA